jgi:hypothetical protein
VDTKYIPATDVPNAAWFILASNSPQALRLDTKERRWFVPEVGDDPWPREKWAALREWAVSGDGFAHVLYWAQNYEKLTGRSYLKPGEKTPMTAKKQAMIDGSEDESIGNAIDILDGYAATRLQRTDPAKWAALPDEDHPVERRAMLQAEVAFTCRLSELKREAEGFGIEPRDRLSDQHFVERLAAYGVTKFSKRVVLGSGAKVTLLCWGAPPTATDMAIRAKADLTTYCVAVKKAEEKVEVEALKRNKAEVEAKGAG